MEETANRIVRYLYNERDVLPSSHLFAIMLFSKVPISREVAKIFKPLALNAKVALLPFEGETVFA